MKIKASLYKIVSIDGLFKAVLLRKVRTPHNLIRRSLASLSGSDIMEMLESGYCFVSDISLSPCLGFAF